MYQKPKGTQDLLPEQTEVWQFLENTARSLCEQYNYKEIRTPIFEQTELFTRGIGETTDVVEKEMYTFEDKGKRSMSLRPEGTAGIVRAYVENKLHGLPDLSKLYYIGPMFRYEQPQAGRYRQLHQFGVEAIGSSDPSLDAEVIALGYAFYKKVGIQGVQVELNSVGNPESRLAYRSKLQQFLQPMLGELCKDCQSRFDRNPLRILDCKKDQSKFDGVPSILDSLDEESTAHFEAVRAHLDAMQIPYVVNPRLVRGLDYYTHTAFEYKAEGIGAIDTIGGGGRYNGLVEQIGGEDQPGIGFGIGLERTVLILENQKVQIPRSGGLDVFLVALGEQAEKVSSALLYQLRQSGLSAEKDYQGRKLKAQMKAADRQGARFAVIIGEDELSRGEAALKDLESGEQTVVRIDDIADAVRKATSGTNK